MRPQEPTSPHLVSFGGVRPLALTKRQAVCTLGSKATAIARAGWRLRKAEANRELLSAARRMAEIERQLQHLRRNHAHSVSKRQSARPQIPAAKKPNLAPTSNAESIRPPAQNLRGGCASRIARYLSRKSTSWRLSQGEVCTSEPGKRSGSSPCRRSFNRRIAPGHYFRGGQLLVGLLRTLRAATRTLQIEQGIRAHR